jgi:spheroidene monooxygenase
MNGATAHAHPDHTVVVVLAALRPSGVPWGWWRVARGGAALRHEPGLRFARALGSGHEGGFGLRPSLNRQGLLAVFDTEVAARRFVQDEAGTVAAYRRRSIESAVMLLRATSSRGAWGGQTISPTRMVPVDGPVAALTRASIRPSKAAAFWRLSPPAERDLARAEGCLLAVGLGEAPVLRQATLSLWRDQAAMDGYARSGAHQAAIQAAYGGGHFSESMFTRFVPMAAEGHWKGLALMSLGLPVCGGMPSETALPNEPAATPPPLRPFDRVTASRQSGADGRLGRSSL